MPKRAKSVMRVSKRPVVLRAQQTHTPGRSQRQPPSKRNRMAAESDLHTEQSSTVQQNQQDGDWIDEEESVRLSLESENEEEEDEITNADPSSDGSENNPTRTHDNVSNQSRAQVHNAFNDLTVTDNYALDVADAAVRQAMWMLRDAHNVRDNIIRHRIAFLQRREEAKKNFGLLKAFVMELCAKGPYDRRGGRTVAHWESARDYYRDMASKASNAHEGLYWASMVVITRSLIFGHPEGARRVLWLAVDNMKLWEKEIFELQADKELKRQY
jgi:hypothetical protein